MSECIFWIIIDILMLIYYFISGGTLGTIFGVLFSFFAIFWTINFICRCKKERCNKKQMEEEEEDKDQLRIDEERDSN